MIFDGVDVLVSDRLLQVTRVLDGPLDGFTSGGVVVVLCECLQAVSGLTDFNTEVPKDSLGIRLSAFIGRGCRDVAKVLWLVSGSGLEPLSQSYIVVRVVLVISPIRDGLVVDLLRTFDGRVNSSSRASTDDAFTNCLLQINVKSNISSSGLTDLLNCRLTCLGCAFYRSPLAKTRCTGGKSVQSARYGRGCTGGDPVLSVWYFSTIVPSTGQSHRAKLLCSFKEGRASKGTGNATGSCTSSRTHTWSHRTHGSTTSGTNSCTSGPRREGACKLTSLFCNGLWEILWIKSKEVPVHELGGRTFVALDPLGRVLKGFSSILETKDLGSSTHGLKRLVNTLPEGLTESLKCTVFCFRSNRGPFSFGPLALCLSQSKGLLLFRIHRFPLVIWVLI